MSNDCDGDESLGTTACLIIVVEVNASGPPHVLGVWLR